MQRAAQTLFAVGRGGLGLITLIYADFALVWQPVPTWVPAHAAMADGSGIVLLLCGFGLLFPATAGWASVLTLVYCFVWTLLKLPGVFAAPLMEGAWLGVGELAVILAGACALFVRLAPRRMGFLAPGGDFPRLLFGVAIVPIGLAHLVYLHATASFIPHWFPLPAFFAGLTGVAQLLCAAGLLFSIFPDWAAILQSAMFSAFTLIVWVPAIVAAPSTRLPWTAFLVSWIITAAAGIIAARLAARSTLSQKNG